MIGEGIGLSGLKNRLVYAVARVDRVDRVDRVGRGRVCM